MALKWTRKDCIEHIIQLKSPLEEIASKNGNGKGLSPLTSKVRELGSMIRNR